MAAETLLSQAVEEYLSWLELDRHAAGASFVTIHIDLVVMLADGGECISDGTVANLREQGYSWAAIGAALGITRQSAHQRWSDTCAAWPRSTRLPSW